MSKILFYFLGSLFSALVSYRIHVENVEQFALPILEAIINFEGRAPDQYRLIPYLLIGFIQNAIQWLAGSEDSSKFAVVGFDTLCLFAAAMVLDAKFVSDKNPLLIVALFLVYPYTMFDGYRPTGAYLLFLSSIAVILIYHQSIQFRSLKLLILILVFSFSRADVALLMAAIAATSKLSSTVEKAVLLCIPLGCQLLLQYVIFPEAEYFTTVFMLADNLSLQYLANSPLSYLWLGLLIIYRRVIGRFLHYLVQNNPSVLIVLGGYTLVLLLVARPNEYRLFLPLIPIVSWHLRQFSSAPINTTA